MVEWSGPLRLYILRYRYQVRWRQELELFSLRFRKAYRGSIWPLQELRGGVNDDESLVES